MQLIKKIDINKKGRDFVVGDVHGYFNVLRFLLSEVAFNPAMDRLFSVGDLVDRGPHSTEVLEWLDKPWFFPVMGNHEFMVINSVLYNEHRDLHQSEAVGGAWLYSLPVNQQKKIARLFKELPYIVEIDTTQELVALLHADVPRLGREVTYWSDIVDRVLGHRGVKEQRQLLSHLLWNRNRIKYRDDSFVGGISKVYVGHTPLPAVTILGQVVYMDTGSGEDKGTLSVLDINSNTVYCCLIDETLSVSSYILE